MLCHHDILLRCGFIACLTVCFAMLFYQCVQLVTEYADQPYVTKLYTVLDKSVTFPYLRICPTNWINRTAVEKRNMSWSFLEYAMENFIDGLLKKRQYSAAQLDDFDAQFYNFVKANNKSALTAKPTELFDLIHLPCNVVVIECSWMGNGFNCCDFFTSTYTNYGLCYVFQPQTFKQNIAGPGGGLRVRMQLSKQLEPLSIFNRPTDYGALVLPAYLFSPVISDPVFIPAGARGYMELTATQYIRRERCINEYPQNKYLVGIKNSKSSCQYECLIAKLVKQCNCLYFTYNTTPPVVVSANNSLDKLWYCTPKQMVTCSQPKIVSNLPALLGNCSTENQIRCPETCNGWDYRTKASFGRLSENRAAVIKRRFGINSQPSETVDLVMYFSALKHDVVEEVLAQSMDQLIANLASIVDLWIGFSVIAVLRFFVFVALACASKITWNTVREIVLKEEEEENSIVPAVGWKKALRRLSNAIDIERRVSASVELRRRATSFHAAPSRNALY